MALTQYIRLFRRWLWLILLGTFVGAGLSFIVRVNQLPTYQAEAIVIVGSALESPNPNSTEIDTGIDLAVTYAQIARTYNILDAVIQNLGMSQTVEDLNDNIGTSIASGTPLLHITVNNTDRILAAEIANEIVAQLILQSPSGYTDAQQTTIDLLQTEIEAQTVELTTLRGELREINDLLSNQNNLTEDAITEQQTQRTLLTNQINDASSNIAQNLNTIASLSQQTNSVEIIETARIPIDPIGAPLIIHVLLGAFIASSLVVGGVLVYEYLNDTLRSADEVSRKMNLPVLGVISRYGKKNTSYRNRILTNLQSFSHTSEEYRTLRTNLLYSVQEKSRVFLVSSASPEEGKSLTASNLAISAALSGLKVLLIDADLRRPKLHEAFNFDNDIGLSNLLTLQISDVNLSHDDETAKLNESREPRRIVNRHSWMHVVKKTAIPNLSVITSGFIPANPSELLGSTIMKRWMEEFTSASFVDVIIFDTPPALAVADSALLAASLDAKVLLVVRANQTRRGLALTAKERFDNVGAEVVGVVLNYANLREEDYYGFNQAYYYAPQNGDIE